VKILVGVFKNINVNQCASANIRTRIDICMYNKYTHKITYKYNKYMYIYIYVYTYIYIYVFIYIYTG